MIVCVWCMWGGGGYASTKRLKNATPNNGSCLMWSPLLLSFIRLTLSFLLRSPKSLCSYLSKLLFVGKKWNWNSQPLTYSKLRLEWNIQTILFKFSCFISIFISIYFSLYFCFWNSISLSIYVLVSFCLSFLLLRWTCNYFFVFLFVLLPGFFS